MAICVISGLSLLTFSTTIGLSVSASRNDYFNQPEPWQSAMNNATSMLYNCADIPTPYTTQPQSFDYSSWICDLVIPAIREMNCPEKFMNTAGCRLPCEAVQALLTPGMPDCMPGHASLTGSCLFWISMGSLALFVVGIAILSAPEVIQKIKNNNCCTLFRRQAADPLNESLNPSDNNGAATTV